MKKITLLLFIVFLAVFTLTVHAAKNDDNENHGNNGNGHGNGQQEQHGDHNNDGHHDNGGGNDGNHGGNNQEDHDNDHQDGDHNHDGHGDNGNGGTHDHEDHNDHHDGDHNDGDDHHGNDDDQDDNATTTEATTTDETATTTSTTTPEVPVVVNALGFQGPTGFGGSGVTGGSGITSGTPISATATSSTVGMCTNLFTVSLGYGRNNPSDEVKRLQVFLNQELGINLEIDGKFGPATLAAVKAFQTKYASSILLPWDQAGLSHDLVHNPTGYVYKTTLRQINLILCPTANIPLPELK